MIRWSVGQVYMQLQTTCPGKSILEQNTEPYIAPDPVLSVCESTVCVNGDSFWSTGFTLQGSHCHQHLCEWVIADL